MKPQGRNNMGLQIPVPRWLGQQVPARIQVAFVPREMQTYACSIFTQRFIYDFAIVWDVFGMIFRWLLDDFCMILG